MLFVCIGIVSVIQMEKAPLWHSFEHVVLQLSGGKKGLHIERKM